jgi:hypothetical protein
MTGVNFEPIDINNRVTVNTTDTIVNSSSTTSVDITVPQSGSGRIAVATPNGVAVSSADLFIPPSPFTIADVEFTGRATLGSGITATINSANKIGLILVEGIAGQRLGINASNVTINGFGVNVYTPDGNLFYSSPRINPPGGQVSTGVFPSAGTYTLLVDPVSTNTGAATLTLSDVTDVSGPIVANGQSTSLTTTIVEQNARFYFAGTTGQRIFLNIASTPFTKSVFVIKPNGETLATKANIASGTQTFIDTTALPLDGTYTILVDPSSSATGGITLYLFDVPSDLTGAITPGGAAVPISIGSVGQNAVYSFEASVGQKVSLWLTGVTIAHGNLAIKKPDGSNLISTTFNTSGSFIDTQTLPTAGTYSVLLDPTGVNTGNATITLYEVTDATGTLEVGGGVVPVTITTPGQNAQLTFSGTSGQQVTVHITNNTVGCVTVKLLRPNGTIQTSMLSCNGSFSLTTQTLSATGTHTVLIDPSSTGTGGLSLTVTNP